MKKIILTLLRIYQKYLSFDTGVLRSITPFGACRYSPSCSQYMIESVQQYGCSRGLVKGIGRIMRCNPFYSGGYDPVASSKVGEAQCRS